MKKIIMTVIAGLAICANAQQATSGVKKGKALNADKIEARAARMVKGAVDLFSTGEDERAIGMLEAVWRMYPESAARFSASLALGKHYLEKRDFDHALQELRKAEKSAKEEERAETMLTLGRLQLAKGQSGEAVMTLRRLTQDFPTSDFANDAYFTIGEIHFDAKRYTRAAEAFAMVGTAVPLDDLTNRVVLAEAGQRVYVHVNDKDLAVLAALGHKSYVELGSKSGDREKAELVPFGRGDGDFLASIETTGDVTGINDGRLTVRGAEKIVVRYIDANAEDGTKDVSRSAGASIVSSASIAFMDGAQRQRVRGVFAGQPAFIRLRDFDLDVTDTNDNTTVTVKVLYRERPELSADAPPGTPPPPPAPDAPWLERNSIQVKLVETAPRSGIFTGRIIARIDEVAATNTAVKLPYGEIAAIPEDKVVVEYKDAVHLGGTNAVVRCADAYVLVGGNTEPQSIVAHSSEATVQAKKLLLEAQLLCKWSGIFKDVGLDSNAKSKADEGLEKVDDIMSLARRFSLDRSVIESAYEVRWNLFLMKGSLRDAINTCRALVKRYPDTALADRAFMQIANARRAENTEASLNSAIEVYNAIIALPNSTFKAEAQYRIGEVIEGRIRAASERDMKSGKPDYSPAMLAYKRCADMYPSSSYAGESYKRVIDYYISMKDYTRASETLERVFEDYPDAPWLDEMLLKWGVVDHRMGKREGAISKFRRVVEEYPGGKSARQAANFLKKLEE